MARAAYWVRMRAVRELARLSQDDLARLSGVHRSMISSYERGQTMPTLYNAIEIADALHLTVGQLVGVEPLPLNWAKQWEDKAHE